MSNTQILMVAALALAAAGCTSMEKRSFQTNQRVHLQNAEAAEKTGNWESAQRSYYLALQNAERAGAGKKELAALNHKVGRASGITCKYDVAEKHLTKAYELDKKASGPAHNLLVELARMNLAQGKPVDAANNFEKALPGLEKARAQKYDPIGFAEVLEDYATALDKGGMQSQAKTVSARAAEVRAHSQGKAPVALRVAYGSHCGSQQAVNH
jgi:tetratricopeptide (TPR) repeat protein